MSSHIIRNATIVNEGRLFPADLLVMEGRIASIGSIDPEKVPRNTETIEAQGLLLIPGLIDDQVHFREPGLTHKADIFSESKAAAAGGMTSFMDMPNTVPQATSNDILNEKYRIAGERSVINYSFYIGGTNNNLEELLNTDPESVCGIKFFLGSSTGNMLVNNRSVLKEAFARSPMLIACHCEDEPTVKRNSQAYREKYGEDVPVRFHPMIRSREACYLTSSFAAGLAREYNTRLNILHISTADEMKLFSDELPLENKRITGEVCIHHLWFDESDYERLGNYIKWNPAIKTKYDREALQKGVNSNLLDIIATDHAPHTLEEKSNSYFKAPSGGPLVQHALVAMMELYHKGIFTMEKIVEKMCHNPAIIYRIRERGFIREGYKADLCLVDPGSPWVVSRKNILYKCGWSPFEGEKFTSRVKMTMVNGNIVYRDGTINEYVRGERLMFNLK